MKIAKVQVIAPVRVPAGQHLDGYIVGNPTWAMCGEHAIEAEFAKAQEAAGMLEIESIDGVPALWTGCCCNH